MGTDLHLGCCVVDLAESKPFWVLLTNPTGYTQQVDKESWSGQACEGIPICATTLLHDPALVKNANSADSKDTEYRRKLLQEILFKDSDSPLTNQENDKLVTLLLSNHDAFALMEGE